VYEIQQCTCLLERRPSVSLSFGRATTIGKDATTLYLLSQETSPSEELAFCFATCSALFDRHPTRSEWVASRAPQCLTVEGVEVDVSIASQTGPDAARYMAGMVSKYPALRPVHLVLRALLKERKLNDVATGGLSSYSLCNMVVAHLLEAEKVWLRRRACAAAFPGVAGIGGSVTSCFRLEAVVLQFGSWEGGWADGQVSRACMTKN
jgi:hypothetical protein